MSNIIVPTGLLYKILQLLGIDLTNCDDKAIIVIMFVISALVLVFIILMLFKAISSLFKGGLY